MVYLKENKEKEVYSKDIERLLDFQKSWVSTLITQLEKADLISRQRTKNGYVISITDLGLETILSSSLSEVEVNIIKAVKGVTVSGD